MSAEAFMQIAQSLLRQIEETQLDAIRTAGQAMAERVARKGVIHQYDSGHVPKELLHRAGGILIIRPLNTDARLGSGIPQFRLSDELEPDTLRPTEVQAEWILQINDCRPQDVLLIGSVSGRQDFVVTLVQRARKRGILVVAITSEQQSEVATSTHPEGLFLQDVADLVIDNCGIAGDAALEMDGLQECICPTSGLASVVIGWSLVAELVDLLLARGLKPSVLRSINVPDAKEVNDAAYEQYERTGI